MSSPREAQTLDGRGPRIEVDRTRCEGHGLCARTAPELLHLDQIGELVINGRELGGEALDKARAAVRACPSLPCACPKHSALGAPFLYISDFPDRSTHVVREQAISDYSAQMGASGCWNRCGAKNVALGPSLTCCNVHYLSALEV